MSIKKKVYIAIWSIIFVPFILYAVFSFHNNTSVTYNSYMNMLDAYNDYAYSKLTNNNSGLNQNTATGDFNFSKQLENCFENAKMFKTGFVFAVDNKGNILSSKNEKLLPSPENMKDYGEHSVNKAIDNIKSKKNIDDYIIIYKVNSKYIYAKATYIKDYDILLVSAIEKDVMDIPIKKNINIFVAAGILLMLIATVISIVFSRWLTLPLNIIISAIEKNKSENNYIYINYSAKNEFGDIAKSFNQLIDKIRNAEDKIKNDERNYYKALKGINDAVWEWSFADKQFSASDGWENVFNIKPPKTMTIDFLKNNILVSEDSELAITTLKNQLTQKSPYYRVTLRVKTALGSVKWIESKGLTYFDDRGAPIKLLGSITDVTEYKEVQQKLFDIVYYDMLTGVRSKIKLNKDMYELIENHPDQKHCLIILDLDNIKDINDSYGHSIGDMIIKWLADSIEKRLGENDIIGRYGGDEFVIIFSNISDNNKPIEFIKNLHAEIKTGFRYKKSLLPVSFSSGISYYPQDADSAKNLLKYSDIALLEAKNSGKDRYVIFSEKMLACYMRQNAIKLELSRAIENNEIQVYYQPIYDTKTHKLRGAEALTRFISKTMGIISPAEFIPISEQTGDIQVIGLYCLEQSCIMINKLKDSNINVDFISVNLSVKQLYTNGFIERVKDIFEKTNADISKIKFEITESVFINSYKFAIEKIMALKAMGAKIALDDFGSGYSSLSHLSEMPIDFIKIDKSFTDQIITNYKNFNVISLIIMLAERLGIGVIAEGVETKEQLDAYYELNCDMIQGYYFAKPMCGEDFLNMVISPNRSEVVNIV